MPLAGVAPRRRSGGTCRRHRSLRRRQQHRAAEPHHHPRQHRQLGQLVPCTRHAHQLRQQQPRTTRYCAAKTALYNAINGISTATGAKMNIGLMLFNYNNGKANTGVAPTNLKTGNSDGSFVRYAVRPLTPPTRRRSCPRSSVSTRTTTRAWATRRTRCRWRKRGAISAGCRC